MEKRDFAEQNRKMGMILLAGIILVILLFLFCTPVSPLLGGLREAVMENPEKAEGFWGVLGFYKRTADNRNTYFLMLLFFSLLIYGIVTKMIIGGRTFTSGGRKNVSNKTAIQRRKIK